MYAGIARNIHEVEIEAQGLPRKSFDRSEYHPDAVRSPDLSLRTVFEPIVQGWQLRAERRYPHRHGKTQDIDQER
jgi:hypothetical protein